jgi:DNA-binding NtrC family response regulator
MYRLLVVDDEDEVRDAVARRMRREGYEVDQADCLQAAVDAITAANPSYDLVLTDMVMDQPESGVRTLEAALGRDIFTEVIVLTAYGNISNAVDCMRRGAFDYVEKNIPGVDVYELIAIKVKQALERRRNALSTLRRYIPIAEREGIELPSMRRP